MTDFDWKAVSATDCDTETLNRAVLMAAGWRMLESGDMSYEAGWLFYNVIPPGFDMVGDLTEDYTTREEAWEAAPVPVTDSDWAAGFCLDRLEEMGNAQISQITGTLCIFWPDDSGDAKHFIPLDIEATGRAAMCECVCRAYLAWRQGQEGMKK